MSEHNDEYRSELKPELEHRFDCSPGMLEAVLDKVQEAHQMDELDGLHWDDPEGIAEDIESFSRGHGLKTGWNTWIGIQKPETSFLTIDADD